MWAALFTKTRWGEKSEGEEGWAKESKEQKRGNMEWENRDENTIRATTEKKAEREEDQDQ